LPGGICTLSRTVPSTAHDFITTTPELSFPYTQPQRSRTAGTYRRLAKLMAELGWTAVRVRDLTRGGYKEQVRGYIRDARPSNKSN
jgi:hypothetical protein